MVVAADLVVVVGFVGFVGFLLSSYQVLDQVMWRSLEQKEVVVLYHGYPNIVSP